MLGEYSALAPRCGGTFGAGLLENGELEERFDAAPPHRLGSPLAWGGGAEYDATAGSSDDERRQRLYAFLEPIQKKYVYWRVSAAAQKIFDENL